MVFNPEQWAKDHDRRDEDRFGVVNKSLTNIWQVLAFAGTVLIAVMGWSLKLNIDQVTKQDHILQAIYGVSGQVANVQATAVPKTPEQR